MSSILFEKEIKVIQRNNYKLKNKYFKTIFTQVKVVGWRIAISFTGLLLYVEV